MNILIIGDGIALTTGFSQVIRPVAKELVKRGHKIWQIASLDCPPTCDSRPYYEMGIVPIFPYGYFDTVGFQVFPKALEIAKPDVIFMNMDPGMCDAWFERHKEKFAEIPTVIYAPIEGAPIAENYGKAFEQATIAYTYTQWSHDRLKQEFSLDIPFVYHGVDTNVWKPLDYIERKKIRAQLGWEDKYVIAYVARNVMRKAQDRLIKAIQILHDISNDYLLYLHCRAFDGYELGGWNLAWLAHTCGVSDAVQFSDTGTAVSNEQQISLVKKLACADLYVHTAKVEGFGLPIIEAMAVGLPVVVTADGGNIEEVAGNGIAAKIRPVDYDSWFNGAQLANVDPKDIAGVIQHIRGDKQLQKAASQNALRRAQQFSWSAMATTLADAVEQACG